MFMKNSINQFKINKRIIDSNNYPYIVAEISGNHSQSLNKTFKILEILSDIGVDAVKLQSYQPEDITLPYHKEFLSVILYNPGRVISSGWYDWSFI